MNFSIYFTVKVFVSCAMIASLFDMFITQELRLSRYRYLLYRKIEKPAYLNLFKFLIGNHTLDFIVSRTMLFPLAEITFGISVVLSIYSAGLSLLLLPKILFAFFLALLIVVPLSLEDTTTPHIITISGSILGIASGLTSGMSGLINSVFGALTGFGISLTIYYLGVLFAKRQGEPEGDAMGFGLVTTSTMIGAFCGYPDTIPAILSGILLSGAASMIYLLYLMIKGDYKKNALTTYMPGTPFWVMGGAMVIYIQPLWPFLFLVIK
jgi:hypothetical protein